MAARPDYEIVGAPLDKSIYQIDPDTIVREGAFLKARYLRTLAADEFVTRADDRAPKNTKYASVKSSRLYDCDKRTYAELQDAYYSEPMSRGKVVFNTFWPTDKIRFVEPIHGTMTETLLEYVCAHPPAAAPAAK